MLMAECNNSGRAVHGLDRGTFLSILHRIFGLTDDRITGRDKDGVVGMEEWIEGLSVFLRGTLDEKIKCNSTSVNSSAGYSSRGRYSSTAP
uniref:EF-hand domain-containing protein n=1 Tax=Oreochromis aureus TaxID=47969 RepID=A0A668TKM5_OREAU